MQRSTDRHLWWDSIAIYEVVRIIHEADGVLLCISVSGRNCGTTSKTHILTCKRLIVPLLRLFVPLIRAEKKIRRPDWTAFFAPFGEYNMRVAKCRITLRVGTCV